MGFKFNQLQGKLIQASQGMAYALRPPKESLPMVYGTGWKPGKVSKDFVRLRSQTGGPSEKLKTLYRHYQADNDIPIYLKGGKKDYVLYYSTLGLAAYCSFVNWQFLYMLAFP